MALHVEPGPTPGSYRLIGELDLSTVEEAERGLSPAKDASGTTVIDLSELTFMDSSGVRMVLTIFADHRMQGREVVLRDPTSAVRRLFDVLELEANGVRVETAAAEGT
jgi:anti-anti-sigma factor